MLLTKKGKETFYGFDPYFLTSFSVTYTRSEEICTNIHLNSFLYLCHFPYFHSPLTLNPDVVLRAFVVLHRREIRFHRVKSEGVNVLGARTVLVAAVT